MPGTSGRCRWTGTGSRSKAARHVPRRGGGSSEGSEHRRPAAGRVPASPPRGVRLRGRGRGGGEHAPLERLGVRRGPVPPPGRGGFATREPGHRGAGTAVLAPLPPRAGGEHAPGVAEGRGGGGGSGRCRGDGLHPLHARRHLAGGGQGGERRRLLVPGLPGGWARGGERGHRAGPQGGLQRAGAHGGHRHLRSPGARLPERHRAARGGQPVPEAALCLADPLPAGMAPELSRRRRADAVPERGAPRRADGLRGGGGRARAVGGLLGRSEVDPRAVEGAPRHQGNPRCEGRAHRPRLGSWMGCSPRCALFPRSRQRCAGAPRC